jgi:caa(3)-type oxidase subunit IV
MAEHTEHAAHPNYRNIYLGLLALLVVSVIGPMFGILWLTLATAFGIALIKATLVVQNFMHLKWERQLVGWFLAAALLLMFLMFAGVAPDVMSHEGANWENFSAREAVERGIPLPGEGEGAVEH